MATITKPTTHIVKLKERHEVAYRTLCFTLERPNDFKFTAGQFAEIGIVDNAELQNEMLAFSMASAPDEADLMFATRLRGGNFKHTLETMPIGATIKLEGPFGKFTLDESTRPAVFIVGGIGITPVRSILVHASKQHVQRDLVLLYSNRRPEDAAFLQELASLQKDNPRFRLVAIMTGVDNASHSWGGETGHLNFNTIANHTRHYSQPLFYIAGSPRFVKAFRELLLTNGIPKQDLHSEDFAGY
ncbi:MAG TPA: FAD-dependent oxidoreductase [Candidatus Obscuribacterales bacterium]